jgi:hypothetical protein
MCTLSSLAMICLFPNIWLFHEYLRFSLELVDHFVIPNLPLLMLPKKTFLCQKWTYYNLMICMQPILACWNLPKITNWNHQKFQLSSASIGYNDQLDYLVHICWGYLSSHMEDHLISTFAPYFPNGFVLNYNAFPFGHNQDQVLLLPTLPCWSFEK